MTKLEDNIARAKGFMANAAENGVMNHIDGASIPATSGKTFEIISPVDLSVLAQVAAGDAADIDAAAVAAQAAFKIWSKTPGSERRRILIRVAEAIEARADEIALTECIDTGQALRFMSKAALRGAANFRFFADQAPSSEDGEVTRTPTQMNTTSRRPIGPVGVITPWNTPFMLSTWKIAPALAAGCTVVHKPAEFSPMSAKLLVEIAELCYFC